MIQLPPHVHTLLAALQDAGFAAYPVGGCVRDSLMGRVPADWDVCTAAKPEDTARVFDHCRLIETGMKHGTVTVLTNGGPVEVTTFRADGAYGDSRHPDAVTFVPRVEDDLARRDFTVNAMALAPDGEIIDLYGGQDDLKAGIIRCVGDADIRFGEDALRVLRALRFASKLDFTVEENTARSVLANRARLAHVSPERIFSELKGLLTGPGAGRMLRQFAPVIFEIIPELKVQDGFDQKNPNHIHDIWTHTTMAVDAIEPDPVLRLTMLLHDVGKPEKYFTDEAGVGHFYGHAEAGVALADTILRRLRCDNATRESVTTFIKYHDIEPPQTEKSMRRLLSKLGEDTVRRLIACWRADSSDRSDAVRRRNFAVIDASERVLEKVLTQEVCFGLRDLTVNGNDIMALGVEKGPAVGRILNELFRQVIEEEMPNDRDILLEKAAEIIAF